MKTKEDYYQEIVEKYLGTITQYMDFLLNCIENKPENNQEFLARKEFIDNWHDELLKQANYMYRNVIKGDVDNV